MNPLPLDIPFPKDDAGGTSGDMSHTGSTPDENVSEPTNHSDDPARAPSGEQHSDVQPKPVKQQRPAVEEPSKSTGPRRSTRTTAEPQRLNIQAWGGQSYDGIAGQVGQVPAGQIHHGGPPQGYSGVSWPHPVLSGQTMPFPYNYVTPLYSVGHNYGLHPSVPGGGGGISGYGLPSNPQTMHWPGSLVNNNG